MQALRAELSRGVTGALGLAARAVPAPRPDVLALASRSLPAPVTAAMQRALRQIPPEHLQAALRLAPVRRAMLEAIFWQMPLYLDAASRPTASSAIRWQLSGRPDGVLDVYDVVIADGRVRCIRGGGEPPPRLTVTAEPLELIRIALGRSDPFSAYLAGRLSMRGDLMQAARLMGLVRLPGGGRRRAQAP